MKYCIHVQMHQIIFIFQLYLLAGNLLLAENYVFEHINHLGEFGKTVLPFFYSVPVDCDVTEVSYICHVAK